MRTPKALPCIFSSQCDLCPLPDGPKVSSIPAMVSCLSCGLNPEKWPLFLCAALQQQEIAFRRLHSYAVDSGGRAISVPLMDPKVLRPGLRLENPTTPQNAESSFPRSSPPPDYKERPAEFQV